MIVPLLGLFELRRVLRTLVSVGRRRQRRLVYRFEGDAPADCYSPEGHVPGRLVDASPAGVGLVTEAPLPIGARPAVHLELRRRRRADARDRRPGRGPLLPALRTSGFLIGATIVDIDADSRMWLMEWCYVVCSHERLRGHRPSARAAGSRADRHPARRRGAGAGARRLNGRSGEGGIRTHEAG